MTCSILPCARAESRVLHGAMAKVCIFLILLFPLIFRRLIFLYPLFLRLVWGGDFVSFGFLILLLMIIDGSRRCVLLRLSHPREGRHERLDDPHPRFHQETPASSLVCLLCYSAPRVYLRLPRSHFSGGGPDGSVILADEGSRL